MSKAPIGLQLFAVRGECRKDLPATLRSVRELGYQAVEPWGYNGDKVEWMGRPAKELRLLLDDAGLACCGMHLSTAALLGDNLARTIELNQTLGNRFCIVAMDKARMSSEPGIAELADILAATAAALGPLNMATGYHAHAFDFERVGGRTAWDNLFSRTAADIIMQLDIGNCASGGGDPVGILRKFPGRARSVHLKDFGGPDGSVIGEGQADWKEIFRLVETSQNTEWFVVEEGSQDGTGFDIPRRSLEALKKMGR
jgi:sugar phosphate isomerase/epimerase